MYSSPSSRKEIHVVIVLTCQLNLFSLGFGRGDDVLHGRHGKRVIIFVDETFLLRRKWIDSCSRSRRRESF